MKTVLLFLFIMSADMHSLRSVIELPRIPAYYPKNSYYTFFRKLLGYVHSFYRYFIESDPTCLADYIQSLVSAIF